MSLNPALGHLYHDDRINGVFTALDVKDKLRTREINARESKQFEKYESMVNRAMSVCRRRYEYEQRHVRNNLSDIRWKTPTLTSSLRRESERTREHERPHTYNGRVSLPDVNRKHDASPDSRKELVLVSSWSVFSNKRTRTFSAPEQTTYARSASSRGSLNQVSSRARAFTKKTQQVTHNLHRLYKNSVERKLKEHNTTVLDILGRESKEELEKALFVLRGTPAGDAIEDILRARQFVSNGNNNSSLAKRTVSDIFVTQLDTDENKAQSVVSLESEGTSLPTLTSGTGNLFIRGNIDRNNNEFAESPTNKSISTCQDIKTALSDNVFDSEDPQLMSSVLGNASDTDPCPKSIKWTEIFKAPELWRQQHRNVRTDFKTPRAVSLVTLTGKRRQTMLKR